MVKRGTKIKSKVSWLRLIYFFILFTCLEMKATTTKIRTKL